MPTGASVCRGHDAIAAIGDLGALPSVMKMTRLMILREKSDLSVIRSQNIRFGEARLGRLSNRVAGQTTAQSA
jgi:hypothetical protein